ncbi:MAG: rod shape-determining protein MreC [Candidatus Omnitrophota bacterium]|nr:rod shape-determining protein MreC [Candidatus Omnitrophota bacterium]
MFAALLIAAIVIFLSLPPVYTFIKRSTISMVSAPSRFLRGAGVYFRRKADLEEDNRVLRKDLAEMSLRVVQFKQLREENTRLRKLLEFKKTSGLNTVSAGIIARDPNDWVGTFVIDKGSRDGIKKDSAVCSFQGLLGKIAEVSESTSSVMLISHPSFKSGGKIKNTSINGIVTGAGKGKANMLYLPVDAEVRTGAIVLTSDYSSIFPKGIIMGRVTEVTRSKTGMYKRAGIEPYADPLAQEEVLCVKEN